MVRGHSAAYFACSFLEQRGTVFDRMNDSDRARPILTRLAGEANCTEITKLEASLCDFLD